MFFRCSEKNARSRNRRTFLSQLATMGAVLSTGSLQNLFATRQPERRTSQARAITHTAVVGAGAFGGWTALHLLRAGHKVTLIDAWGPGNSRASSGGETRIIRATYGANQPYTKMVARSLQLWRDNQQRWGLQLYHQIGVLWMAAEHDEFERASLPMLREATLPFEELNQTELVKRYPQINFERVKWAIYEIDAGYLTARRACEAVLAAVISEGGHYQQAQVKNPVPSGGELSSINLSDGTTLSADRYVFACGPWLPVLFPYLVGELIAPTRQEVFFFGTPAGDSHFSEEDHMPAWIDPGNPPFYGIPGNQWRGFKVATDARGPLFDPTRGERIPTPERIQAARDYLTFRFPGLKGSPLLETRVCQYENSPDHNFIMDRHPTAENVWIVGGGSGHGFKHGPVVGEMTADLVLGRSTPPEWFRLSAPRKRL